MWQRYKSFSILIHYKLSLYSTSITIIKMIQDQRKQYIHAERNLLSRDKIILLIANKQIAFAFPGFF